ncbi:DUF4232 domain-containing protein [Streptomyces sp. RLB3-17]|uniref:DUF4232 domain-containing protein n=1 Tax=Streptomyces mirabilis TaxID=68239 RepID=A0ABU3UNP7_9ACTN|nr:MULTISPECIES: DUF4232 domain-containing protein [Streptomyces]MCX4610755.1 DUF4232 domain-containing protein [Streptomyces mirabilis]MCX5350971.1 DUF4232 domain-containing protein [Streptomyces mirabilis]MDU8995550.1 DUF4232 domain-containing protein [Streptomyces mirabilis]NMI59962.1 DUF4232 domain-containing protein [Streptomyces sp. RLA2-12]QDN59174.1 DUF4232 domain-containing protein [Streptomyces sp. S1D4-20]
MRALPIAVVAAAAALTLTACDSGGSNSTEGGKKASTASSAAASSTACKIDQIGIQVGPANAAPTAGDTGNVPVTLTNKGAECTLQGFPAVKVQDGGTGTDVPEEKSATPPKLTLAASGTASFTITYVRGTAGDGKSLAATTLKIGLPGAATTQSFKWSYGPLAGKTGPNDPNASVSSFQPAGD